MENELQKALQIVQKIQKEINLVRWTPEQYHKFYGKRTINEILESKEVNYMNPCADLTFATTILLNEAGFKTKIIADELIAKHTKKPMLHFAIEIQIKGNPHTIEFQASKKVLVYKGKYSHEVSMPKLTHLKVHEFDSTKLKRTDSILTFTGIKTMGKLKDVFSSFRAKHLKASFEAMQKSDNIKLFNAVTRKKPKIEIKHL
ncbi:MAG: hypothetical protein JW703_05400 [Candidatus Diapherotrites archaeon]|nr:hypothetical protein [Candidatus Diapherotrites archaeon]